MADTSFADGDLFIGLGNKSGGGKKGGSAPPPPPPKGKKRKGEQIGNMKKKRPKHQAHPQPLPGKDKGKAKVRSKASVARLEAWKDKQKRGAKTQRDAFHELAPDSLSKGSPWAHDVDWERCRDPAEMLNDEVMAFYNFIAPTEGEYTVRKLVIELITGHVRKWKPEMDVVAFGSWQTQLYLPTGDLDLVVVPPPNRPWSNRDTANVLTNLSVVLRNSGIADKIALVLGAKVPIMKFVTRPAYGSIPVDISFNQTNGIDAGKIITHYLDALPGARELITVVKYFLSERQMNEVFTGGLGSYSVICLVISFMQMHPKLRRSEMDAQRNLGTLLLEFFELYGRSFNYDSVGISIRNGGEYFLKRDRGWQKRSGNPSPFLLAIEDPQNADNDISGGSYGLPRVKMTFGGAYDMVRQRMFDRAAQILSRDQGGASRQPHGADEYSILSCILGVEEDTIAFRTHLNDLFARGDLASDLEAFMKRTKLDVRLQDPPLPPSLQMRRRPSDMDLESGGSGDESVSVVEVSDDDDGDDDGDGDDDNGGDEDDEDEEAAINDVPAGAGAIVIDDSDVSDGASSHTEDSSDEEGDSGAVPGTAAAAVAAARDARSVSEDVDLYDSAPASNDESDSRYTAAMDAAARRKSKAKGKGKGRAAEAEAEAEAASVGSSSSDERPRNSQHKAPPHAASAGPSRTTSPPLRILGASAASAPTSPSGRSRRPERWVRPAERAKYWAAKSSGEPIDLTHDSE